VKRYPLIFLLSFVTTYVQSSPESWRLTFVSWMTFSGPGPACQWDAKRYYDTYGGDSSGQGVGGGGLLGGGKMVAQSSTYYTCFISVTGKNSGVQGWKQLHTAYTEESTKYVLSANENNKLCDNAGDTSEGNPCDVVTGRKTEVFPDYTAKSIKFNRLYNSQSIDAGSRLGGFWRHSFEARHNQFSKYVYGPAPKVPPVDKSSEYPAEDQACTSGWGDIKATYRGGSLSSYSAEWEAENEKCVVKSNGKLLASPTVTKIYIPPPPPKYLDTTHKISAPDGVTYSFKSNGAGGYYEDHGEAASLIIDEAKVIFTSPSNEIFQFEEGLLTSKTLSDGTLLTISRDEYGLITSVNDPYDQSISFTYDENNQLAAMTHANGVIQYTYDANDNLSTVTYEDASTITYHYENLEFPHHLTGYTDQNGIRFASWTYDEEGRANSSQHAVDVEKVEMEYLSDRTIVTDALGAVRTYHLGNLGGKRVVTNITGDRCKDCNSNGAQGREYDNNGLLISKTDWEGNSTHYSYNALGLETERTEAFGTALARTTSTSWHANFILPTQIDENGRTSRYDYDAKGRLLSRTIEDANDDSLPPQNWTYTYSELGLLTTIDGPLTGASDITTITYDEYANLISVTNALGQTKFYSEHNGLGLPGKIIDENGQETLLSYSIRGNLESVTLKAMNETGTTDAVTSFTYDGVGQVTKVTSPTGEITSYEYDDARRLIAIINGLGERIEYTLDLMGNETQRAIKNATQETVYSQSSTYDKLSQLLNTISPLGDETQFEYDANGQQSKIIDAMGQHWTSQYDALKRLVAKIDPETNEVGYGYDALGRVASVTDQRGLMTTYTYDAFNNLLSQTSPDTGITTYQYNEAGQRIRQTDSRGVLSEYSYDALGRLTFVHYPDQPNEDITYHYDETTSQNKGVGHLTRVVDQSGSESYRYDGAGNLIQVTQLLEGVSYVTQYAYDLANKIIQIKYPYGRLVNYQHDLAGQVSQITTQADAFASEELVINTASYMPFGPLNEMTFSNGVTRSMNFDQSYRLAELNSTVQQLSYGYDENSNITQISNQQDAALSEQFSYDGLSRLKSAQGQYGSLNYTYDSVGNRLSRTKTSTENMLSESYHYAQNSNRLLSILVDDNAVTSERLLGYAVNGNIQTDQHANKQLELTYNAQNRLEEVKKNNEIVGLYVHNAAGQRVIKVAIQPDANHHFQYNLNGQLLSEANYDKNILTEYIYLNNQLVAVQKSEGPEFFNQRPQINSSPIVDAKESEAYQYSVIATDFENDQLAYTLNASPSGMTIDETGQINWLPSGAQIGEHEVIVYVFDGKNTAEQSYVVSVVVNEAPTNAVQLSDSLILEDEVSIIAIESGVFLDPEDDVLTYVATQADGLALASWQTFDAQTQVFTFSPENSDVGAYIINVNAIDVSGKSVQSSFELTVQNVNDAPLIVSPLTDKAVPEGRVYSHALNGGFSDIDVGDTLHYSASLSDDSLWPTWLTLNSETGLLESNPSSEHIGNYSINVTVTDITGSAVMDTFLLAVESAEALTLNGGSAGEILIGGWGDDTIRGNAGDDVLDGLQGNDYLRGDAGQNIYRFGLGYDSDQIYNYDQDNYNSWASDTLQLVNGMNLDNITYIKSGSHLILESEDGADRLTIINWFHNDSSRYGVANVQVDDGPIVSLTAHVNNKRLTLRGTEGDDTINVTTSGVYHLQGLGGDDELNGFTYGDVFEGGPGNDTIVDNSGSNVFIFNLGDGQDTISVYNRASNYTNKILFGENITLNDLAFSFAGNSLMVNVGATGERIQIYNWIRVYNDSSYQIELIEFADGSQLDLQAYVKNANLGAYNANDYPDPEDLDGDSLLDDWEYQYFGSLDQAADGDFDQDGYSNLQEFLEGTDPTINLLADTDNDNISDAWELQYFGNLDQTATGDFDQDGHSNLKEYLNGTDPTVYSNVLAWANPNLLAAYSMDQISGVTLVDESLNNDDGTISGATSVKGKFGLALSFDGTSSTAVTLGTDLGDTVPTSTSFWIKPEIENTNGIGYVLQSSDYADTASNYYGYAIYIGADGTITVHMGTGGTPGPSSRLSGKTVGAIDKGVYSHVVVNIYAFGSYEIYINGIRQSLVTSGSGSSYNAGTEAGKLSKGSAYSLFADLDQIRFYSQILTESEVLELYGESDDVVLADIEGDNLPDVWELQYFGNLDQAADGDFDQDGSSNLEEYLDGTDPTANSSVLAWANPNLLAAYTMDNLEGMTLIDESPNNDHGTISGAPLVMGKFGLALSFDGSSSATVSLGTDLGDTVPTSTSFWIKPEIDNTNGIGYVLQSSDFADTGSNYYGYAIYVGGDGTITVHMGTGGTPTSSSRLSGKTVGAIDKGVYSHVVVNINAFGSYEIYINGTRQTIVTSGSGSSYNPGISAGKISKSSYSLFADLDQIRFYSRILTESEVLELYEESVVSTFGDIDGDSLPDEWELQYFSSLVQTAEGDFDQDGYTNMQEHMDGTDPINSRSGAAETDDLDGDGMLDRWEMLNFATLVRDGSEDFDGDSANDSVDAFPLDAAEWLDTDGDGVGNNADTDDDNDQVPDAYEISHGMNSLDSSDASADLDGNGFTNLEEFQQGMTLSFYEIDNTDAQTSQVGDWPNTTTGAGFIGNDWLYHEAGSGANTFSWNFPNGADRYEVYANWVPKDVWASNAEYIIETTSGPVSIQVDQRTGGDYQLLGTFDLPTNAKVTINDNADAYVIADAVKIVQVDPAQIRDTDGDGVVDAEDAFPSDITEWLDTDGDGVGNNVDEDDDNDQVPDTYEISHGMDALDNSDASADLDGNGFTNLQEFQQGLTLIFYEIDNTDAQTSQVGDWPNTTTGVGFIGNDWLYHEAGTGANTFSWNFPNGADRYEVYANWVPKDVWASNAVYIIETTSGPVSVQIDQRTGGGYQLLGTFNLPANATVTINDNADSYVIADAIKIQEVAE